MPVTRLDKDDIPENDEVKGALRFFGGGVLGHTIVGFNHEKIK